MKTYLTYGAAMAIGGALVLFGLFFSGFHSDVARLGAAQWIGGCVSLVIAAVCLHLGLRARLAEVPATEDFGYGRALGNGVMIVLFASLFSTVVNFVYFKFINPGFVELVIRGETLKAEARGASAAQIEQMEKVMQTIMSPGLHTAIGFFGGLFMGTIVALVVAAFSRRPAVDAPPELG